MRLKHRVHLQHENATQDGAGQRVNSWVTYRNCFAHVTDNGSKEAKRGQIKQIESVAGTTVALAYPRQGRFPSTQDRVVYFETTSRTRTMNIAEVQVTEDKRRLLLNCSEVVN